MSKAAALVGLLLATEMFYNHKYWKSMKFELCNKGKKENYISFNFWIIGFCVYQVIVDWKVGHNIQGLKDLKYWNWCQKVWFRRKYEKILGKIMLETNPGNLTLAN